MPAARYGSVPFGAQIQFFLGKGLIPTDTWRDVWQSEHDAGFMVAGATKAELLGDMQAAVAKAITQGTTLQTFRKDFAAIVQEHGWTGWTGEKTAKGRAWRTRVIYETNLRTSYQAGRWAQIQALKARRPYLIYKHNDSVRFPRPLHQSWDGLVLPVDDPWWQTHFPPNGWGCKCSVRSLSRQELARRGLEVGTPPDDGIDPKTGGPAGIDEGWAYAPGATRSGRIATGIRQTGQKLPPDIKQALLRDIEAALAQPNGPGVPPPPSAPAAPAAPALSPTFSTVGGVTGEALDAALRRVPGAKDQLDALGRFLDAHEVKTLALRPSQMGRAKTGRDLDPEVTAFLGVAPGAALPGYYHTTRNAARTRGFTSPAYDHVVVKVQSTTRLADADGAALADAVRQAATATDAPWSLSRVIAATDEATALLATWAHEIGHQLHYWAGRPPLPAVAQGRSLTRYALTNASEWHAEHFAAWLGNRAALAAWSPEVAEYFDELVELATLSTRKSL